MEEQIKLIIKDPIGLHARPASIMVQEASKFQSDIILKSKINEGNLKSIMSVMALGVKNGEEIVIVANGEDAKEAISSLEDVMKKNNVI